MGKKKRNRLIKPSTSESRKPPKRGLVLRLPVMPVFYVLIAIVCLAAYARIASFGLTNFDDKVIITTFTKSHYSIVDVLTSNAYMQHKGGDYYRPLQSITFLFDQSLGNGSALPYHITSLLLHILAVCCLLRLLLLLGFHRRLAFFSSLVFAASPIFAQAVAWVPGRGDLLLGIVGILAFSSLLKFVITGRQRFIWWHGITLFLAMLSKENAVLLPVLFAFWLLLNEKTVVWRPKMRALVPIWIAEITAFLLMRHSAMSSLPTSALFGLQPLMHQLRALPEMLTGFFMPYKIPVIPSFTPFATAFGLTAVGVIAALLILQKKINRRVIFGVTWFVLLSVPGMMYAHSLGSFSYDYLNHRSYLPMVGMFMVFAEAVPSSWYLAGTKLFYSGAWALVAVLCILASRQAGVFFDEPTFDDFAVCTNQHSVIAWCNRGKLRADTGHPREAIGDFNQALKLLPSYAPAYNDRANCRGALNDIQGALEDLTKAITLNPRYALAYSNLGRWKAAAGDTGAAMANYDRSISLDSTYAGVYNNRGVIFAMHRDFPRAVADFETAIRIEPTFSDAMVNFGRAKIQSGDPDGACALWTKAARLGNAEARSLTATICTQLH